MIQGFTSHLIPGEVVPDIGNSTRTEMTDLSLDQNFTNQGGINYVSMPVSTDLSLGNRNFYSTVSLPQTIVGTIDQQPEALSSVYATSSDHILDKNTPMSQPYQGTVGVSNLITMGTVIPHPVGSLDLADVPPLSIDASEKTQLLHSIKPSFASRTIDTLNTTDFPKFLEELNELRKAVYSSNKADSFEASMAPVESNPPLSRLPQLLDEYKGLVRTLRQCFVCPTCNKAFTTQYSLTTHLSTHSGLKPFECPHEGCGKFFRTRTALNTHFNLTHNQNKTNICSTCGKAFAKAWLLRQHELRHTKNHRYVCSKCNQSFAYPYLLKEHEITKHEGIKPYVCSFQDCRKQFSSKNSLYLHQLAHSRPFVCNVCYHSFGYACDLKRHQRKVHNMNL